MKKIIMVLFLSIFLPNLAFSASFYYDADKDGDWLDATKISDHLDLVGSAVIQNDLTDTTSGGIGTFTETGTFSVSQYDSLSSLTPGLDAIFDGNGTLDSDDSFSFDGGTLSWYLSDSTYGTVDDGDGLFMGIDYKADDAAIATWTLTGGGGALGDNYEPLLNGTITAYFELTSVVAGYFYDENGTDWADLLSDGTSIMIVTGLATTNAHLIKDDDIKNKILTETSEYLGEIVEYDPDATDDGHQTIVVSDNGQFIVDVVPEPATLLLFGLGLLGFAGLGRRRRV